MAKRIIIDPVTRIEGHAKISIYLDDEGNVSDAEFHVVEFRGFEKFCEGRPYSEMPGITPRICGICPVSHLLAAAKAGDAIIPLQALEQVYVNFLVPQQRLQDLREGLKIEATSDSFPGELFSGVITAVDPLIDSATRNVKVQATFPNAQEHLKPGMFVGVRIFLPKADPVVVVPASAILYAPYGDSVFLVEEKKDPDTGKTGLVARQQFVKVGGSRGDFVSLVSGVKAGDTVVTTGVFKLRNGVAVTVDNSLAPTVQLAPKPNDS